MSVDIRTAEIILHSNKQLTDKYENSLKIIIARKYIISLLKSRWQLRCDIIACTWFLILGIYALLEKALEYYNTFLNFNYDDYYSSTFEQR